VTPHKVGTSIRLNDTDAVVVAANRALLSSADSLIFPPAHGQRVLLSRTVKKRDLREDTASKVGAELAEEGRAMGLHAYTNVEVIERPMANREGGEPVYLFRVYGS
jgi:hypothetical protein